MNRGRPPCAFFALRGLIGRISHALIGTFRVLGLATQFVPPIEFPGLPNLIVTDVLVEPFDPRIRTARTTSTGAFTNTYTGSGAKVTATYRTMFDEIQPLTRLAGRAFRYVSDYSADLGSERTTVPGRAWVWIAADPNASPTTSIRAFTFPTDLTHCVGDVSLIRRGRRSPLFGGW